MNAQPADQKHCCAILYEMPLTTLLLGNSFHPGGNQLTRQLAEQAFVGPGSQVLDIACGQGNSARLLADEFGATITGVDYSASLLDTAQQLTQAAGLTHRVKFLQVDVQHLPCSDQQFDVVFCECALCTFADAPQVLAEIFRVLKPGGRLALSDVTINAPIPGNLQSVLGQALCIAGAHSNNEYQNLIESAGFKAPRCHDVSSVLLETVQQIEQRLQLAEVITALQQIPLPQELADKDIPSADVLASARNFIHSGGIGYMLFVARTPFN